MKKKSEAILRRKIAEVINDDVAKTIIQSVKKHPDYFVKKGGPEGTYQRHDFMFEYGEFLPEITRFAVDCGGQE